MGPTGLVFGTDSHVLFLPLPPPKDNGLVQKLTDLVDRNKHLESSAQLSREQQDRLARQVNVLQDQGLVHSHPTPLRLCSERG